MNATELRAHVDKLRAAAAAEREARNEKDLRAFIAMSIHFWEGQLKKAHTRTLVSQEDIYSTFPWCFRDWFAETTRDIDTSYTLSDMVKHEDVIANAVAEHFKPRGIELRRTPYHPAPCDCFTEANIEDTTTTKGCKTNYALYF